jgi:HTH-type transcriptional regulator/antitoxin HigA
MALILAKDIVMIAQPVDHFAEVFFEVTKKPSNPKVITTLSHFWSDVSRVLSVPHSEKEYQRTLTLFEKLIDIVGDNKTHPLSSLMETLCLLIESYETRHYPKPEVSGNEVLQFLMEQNALTPSDLPEIGNIDEVSEIINGQRELKARQIRDLSERFHVSPEVFL